MSSGARRLAAVILSVVLVVGGGACRRGEPSTPAVDLDGSPRVPDAEGVVESVDRQAIELDGGRRFEIAEDLQAFNSSTRAAMSVLQRKGEYVQVGLDGRTAIWVAAIGAVVPLDEPTVFYQGKLASVSSSRIVFEDGTVLRLAPSVTAVKGQLVRAELDPETRRVRAVVPL